MRWGLICGLILALHGGVAKADITAQQYREYEAKAPGQLKIYVGGLQEGFGWAQAYYTSQDQRGIYCLPKNGLTPDEGFELLKRYIADTPPKDDMFVGVLFLQALVKSFPCPKK